jgi:hypothetical protein
MALLVLRALVFVVVLPGARRGQCRHQTIGARRRLPAKALAKMPDRLTERPTHAMIRKICGMTLAVNADGDYV